MADLPVGSARPYGLHARLETVVLPPLDAPPGKPFRVRWSFRVAARFDAVAEQVQEFPLPVV